MNRYMLYIRALLYLLLLCDTILVYSKDSKEKINVGEKDNYGLNRDKGIESIELSIKTRINKGNFHYYLDDQTQTAIYIPKKGYMFNKVKIRQPWYVYLLNYYKIWDSDNEMLSNMVMVNGMDQKEPYVNIYLLNGDKLFFYIEYYYSYLIGPKPYEIRNEIEKKDHPDGIKIYTQNSSAVILNDSTKYNVYEHRLYNGFKVRFPNIKSYNYKFKNGTKCVKIKIKDELVWEYEDEFPSLIYYYVSLNIIIVQFDIYKIEIYKFSDDKWNLVYTTSVKRLGKEDKKNLFNHETKSPEEETGKDTKKVNTNRSEKENSTNHFQHKQLRNQSNIYGATKSCINTNPNKLDICKIEIILDINDKQSNEFYDYYYNEGEKTESFTCKGNYRIKMVKKGIHRLWGKIDNRYAVSVDIYHVDISLIRNLTENEYPKGTFTSNKKLGIVVFFEGGSKWLSLKRDPEEQN